MFKKVLIANRGAIACRIIRTLKRMGIGSVAIFSDADAGSLHVRDADEAVRIGPGPAQESYLRADAILGAARATGAEAIHPGYGFLSENAAFAEACAAAGIVFIGPTPENMRAFGLKHTARALAQEAGAPLAPGTDLLTDASAAIDAAARIGYPVILKATAGGGGIGMRVCENADDVRAGFEAVARLAAGNFSDSGVFLERFVRRARHIEVQVFGDGAGNVVALGERDCSLQRRNQKVIEETPAPNLSEKSRAALIGAALKLMRAANYRSAGTVEFLYDSERDDFFFLEVNTRLQVEHGVTEQVTGVDLVEWMVRGAAGDYAFLQSKRSAPKGAAMQARIYAEDPGQDFRPSAGVLNDVRFAPDARIETWVEAGVEISAFYDPMIAKLIVTAPDRSAAVKALQRALDATHLNGVETNVAWLRDVARSAPFVTGDVSTQSLREIEQSPQGVRVLSGGPATTVQDYPGRLGHWDVGVPPSGPMDSRAFRIGNALLGNDEGAPGLEITAMGPILKFQQDIRVCLAGAAFDASLDGEAIKTYEPFDVQAGQTLRIGRIKGAGLRGYLLFAGGIDAPKYLGSASCFTLGGFGGHAGRALAAGDVLRFASESSAKHTYLPVDAQPLLSKQWNIRVLAGPHAAPDFFTPEDVETILSAEWRVHYNSNRTGVRLIGPKPQWARRDGGEAGLHPSNIHDNAYAIGAVDFTGDMPIILGPDGPSLGGFVCPFTIIAADLWKIGQLAPGDSLRFELVNDATAFESMNALDASIAHLAPLSDTSVAASISRDPILRESDAKGAAPRVVYRRQGDDNVLVEYGPIVLDLELRLRIHALMLELQRRALPGVIDLTPGVRSLQVHFDPRVMTQSKVIASLREAEAALGDLGHFETPSRIVHLPLSWDDPAIHDTIEKYMRSVRDDAPWTPSNIEFIRRVNGLESIEDVRRTVFDASYLVLGL
ncbi:MAG: urea carboxylase, partial [Caulobacterales bacterium]